MMPAKSGLVARLDEMIWGEKEPARHKAALLRLVRTVLILGRDVTLGQLTLRAMSLVYTTLLSIVPLLALSFSVLKAFGVTNQVRPMLLSLLEPLGEKGVDVAERITEFIERMNVGVLGAVGLVLLLYTSISLIQKIEESLNYIWHTPRPRPIGERFSRYLTVLMVGPLLVFSALGVTASVMNIEAVRSLMEVDALGQIVQVLGRLVPYLLIIAAFTFIYLFIPNARVRVFPALVGGIVGGIAWQTAGWVFAVFIAGSSNYSAIYSGFAILVLFMIWLYLSWLVLLFGASVAFYVQHPEYLYGRGGEPRLSNRTRERLALSAMHMVAGRFLRGERAPSQREFTQQLKAPGHVLMSVLDALESKGLIVPTTDDPPAYLPARDPASITITDLLDTVRAAGEDGFLSPGGLPAPAAVDELMGRLHRSMERELGAMSLRDFVEQAQPGVASAVGAAEALGRTAEPTWKDAPAG